MGDKKTYFFDSHGGLWEALDGTEGYKDVVAFGPTGTARGVNARTLYEVREGETAYTAAKRLWLLNHDMDDEWVYLDLPKKELANPSFTEKDCEELKCGGCPPEGCPYEKDEGPFDLKLKGGKSELPTLRLEKIVDLPREDFPPPGEVHQLFNDWWMESSGENELIFTDVRSGKRWKLYLY